MNIKSIILKEFVDSWVVIMSLKDAINYMKEGVKRNRVIIINQDNSNKYYDEFKELNIEPINLSLRLSELLSGLSQEKKENEAWDLTKKLFEIS